MTSLLTRWERIVSRKGDCIALLGFPENRQLSFRELDALSREQAALLCQNLKDPASSIVAIQMESRIDWMISFLAVLRAGAMVLPIDATSTASECERILSHMRCNAWFSRSGLQHLRNDTHLQLKRQGVHLFKVTSGSTSTPKVIPFTQEQMMADASNILETMEIRASDIQFATIPLGHSYGLGSLVFPFVMQGIALVFNSIPLPGIIARELDLSRATVMPTIPGILQALAHSDSCQLPSTLRLVVSAASPLSVEVALAFESRFGLRIHNFYGSSETGGIAYDSTGDMLVCSGAVGAPLRNVTVEISKRGRIRVRSDAVFTIGNRNREKGQGVQLLPDYGSLESGMLRLLGRSNRTVKHHGKRLDLAQIERILLEHDAVNEAFVAYDEKRHRVVAAVVGTVSWESLCQFVETQLAIWKRPKVIWITTNLPLTARGKPDRSAILQGIASEGKKLQY